MSNHEIEINKIKVVLLDLWDNQNHPEPKTELEVEVIGIIKKFREELEKIQGCD